MRRDDIWQHTQSGPEFQDSEAASSRSQLLDAKIMMVDDEPLMTELIQTYLDEQGYANFIATNDPRQALALLRRERPSLLLLDLMMPGLSGFDILEALRADRALRYTPVIVLTASTGADAKLRALHLGVTDFLAKPVDESELVLRVRNTLAYQQYHDRLAHYDLVTGLANEKLFDEGLDALLVQQQVLGGRTALFNIAVPECRQLRESVGRAAADELAQVLARRLERFAQARASAATAGGQDRVQRVARLGADEFALLLEDPGDAETLGAAARELIGLVAAPALVGQHEVVAGAAVGIAVSPDDGVGARELCKAAALAASAASGGRDCAALRYQFSSPELNASSYRRMTLAMQLRGAVGRGELCLHYQPKVAIASGQVAGVEALVRWSHPDQGLIPPARFIPLAEEIGVIGDIGEWVLERACRDAAAWARSGGAPLKVAINVAKPQFVAGTLCQALRRAVADSGLPPQLMVLELTESMLMDEVDAGLALMHELKALGVTLSIDDFGTGYSSLSYLTRFPLDELKIDRSFVMHMTERAREEAVVRTVIDLGHRLGLQVIAEGVETSAQLEALRRLGCDLFQGYLFSRPVPEAQLLALLRQVRQPG